MRPKWKRGDRVLVTTVNRGLSIISESRARERQAKPETWAGEVVGPSLLGPGWWIVRRRSSSGTNSQTYTVPDREIRPRK
jgi:hypothetical protein